MFFYLENYVSLIYFSCSNTLLIGLLSWHDSHFWVCIKICKVRHGHGGSVTKPDYYYYYFIVCLYCSAASGDLFIPGTNTVTIGPRAFAVACPAAWNSLPAELHEDSLSLLTFRKKLKTYLFISRTWTVICDVTLFVSAANHAFVTF